MRVGDEFWGEAPPPLLPPRTERAALWILDAVRLRPTPTPTPTPTSTLNPYL